MIEIKLTDLKIDHSSEITKLMYYLVHFLNDNDLQNFLLDHIKRFQLPLFDDIVQGPLQTNEPTPLEQEPKKRGRRSKIEDSVMMRLLNESDEIPGVPVVGMSDGTSKSPSDPPLRDSIPAATVLSNANDLTASAMPIAGSSARAARFPASSIEEFVIPPPPPPPMDFNGITDRFLQLMGAGKLTMQGMLDVIKRIADCDKLPHLDKKPEMIPLVEAELKRMGL